ncbi:MAG: EAL domain-containing protein [Lachnospiraceae bacterium]|nr:EAL domain-containing protein [Lachnospiraceae bacterium]
MESKSFWYRIKEFFGFNKMSPYEKAFHRDANIRSTFFMALIIIVLESWMIIRFIKKYVLTGQYATVELFFKYSKNYWLLLLIGVFMLVYSVLYTNNKISRSPYISTCLTIMFTGVCMYFGWKVSESDFSKGRMILCFLTMVLYAACLLIWRPYISIIMLSVIGITYIHYLDVYGVDLEGNHKGVLEADMINYATFFISLTAVVVSIYHQRHSEARKSAKLIKASMTDDLTGISNPNHFAEQAEILVAATDPKSLIYLYFNIANFKTYNDHMGYEKGNDLLIKMAEGFEEVFKDGICGRMSDDHFMVLTKIEGFESRIEKMREFLKKESTEELYLELKVGGYRPDEDSSDPRSDVDRARYAAHSISHHADKNYIEYDRKMEDEFKLRQHILNNIDKAIREDYIQVYYQPVVWSDDKKLCGCEALARWNDPKFGFLSPGKFIPILEESRQINKLDLCVYEKVCRSLREKLDKGEKIFPVSLNFSRLDFELMDAVSELEKLVEKYRIPKDYLHVEITESALTDETGTLKSAMESLHEKGYSIWLDDFGSGYSSLNVLKDYEFDVLKIDMVFLKNFENEQIKGNSCKIIGTILDLADALGMKTLTEGVESEEAARFLTEKGCGRLQGYFYGKPMSFEDIYNLINSGKLNISDEIL